ncbi:unnamed protein product [Rangifer tarandus platyrhynchus]|uniref:Uncharacterized protein n=2 Tax=Rangifer tarandus platyrhynchus TaxID=3082113 RepID=A0ACB0F624_RANTA|nr:unnamed protein product [Rangifer tarandus platyrhynchus]CAI9708371.1 unnamed protein product [Rangifer tarandus platyrhynchus]
MHTPASLWLLVSPWPLVGQEVSNGGELLPRFLWLRSGASPLLSLVPRHPEAPQKWQLEGSRGIHSPRPCPAGACEQGWAAARGPPSALNGPRVRFPPLEPHAAPELQELQTELELAVPVFVEDPAPGEHRDSGTGPRVKKAKYSLPGILLGGLVVAAQMCRPSCSEDRQQLLQLDSGLPCEPCTDCRASPLPSHARGQVVSELPLWPQAPLAKWAPQGREPLPPSSV